MNTVDRIIFDALAARRGVVLPDVGTLEVNRVGARRVSDTRIVPPQTEVAFAPEWGAGTAGSLVAAIAARRGVSESEAATVYGEWLDGARRGEGAVSLGAAGEISDGRFVASEELLRALNPAGGEAVTMDDGGRRRRSLAWLWIVAAVAIALAVLCAMRCCKEGGFTWGRKAAPVSEVVEAPPPTPAAADVAAAETARAKVAEAEAAAAGRYTGTDRFHVIIGAFAVESNADNYIARLKREHPELTPVKLPQPGTGYNMVSILQASSKRQAVNKMNLYWDLDPGLWIYEQK